MAKEYSVGGDGLTLANQAVTLVFINPAAAVSPMLNVLRLWASQQGSATSAQQRIEAETQVTAFPTLVSATPRHLRRSDTVASLIVGGTAGAAGTCGINASAEGAGAKTVMFGDNFNVLNGYLWVPTPREVIELAAGDASGFGLFLPAAAATLTNWAVGLIYGEGS
jgi:hypothetical protein